MDTENNVRRGYVPSDERDFSDNALPLLRRALSDLRELLDRGYDVKGSALFVGNHYQLSERQRLMLCRAASAKDKTALREEKRLCRPCGTVYIDGFNIIITLETALSGTTLYRCCDGTVRDLAALRGNYRIIGCTCKAVDLVLEKLSEQKAEKAVFYLDRPVSNSGRLRSLILKEAERFPFETVCEIVNSPDDILKEKENVVTSDAIILNECKSWLNYAAEIIAEKLTRVRVADPCEQPCV